MSSHSRIQPTHALRIEEISEDSEADGSSGLQSTPFSCLLPSSRDDFCMYALPPQMPFAPSFEDSPYEDLLPRFTHQQRTIAPSNPAPQCWDWSDCLTLSSRSQVVGQDTKNWYLNDTSQENQLDLGTALPSEKTPHFLHQDENASEQVVKGQNKARRIKALEKAFGHASDHNLHPREKARLREIARRKGQIDHIGEVDRHGEFITQGRLKRKVLRWAQGLLALVAAIGTFGVTFALHPNTPPPPHNTPPLFIFYALSVISLAFTLWFSWLFHFCRRTSRSGPLRQHSLSFIQQQQPKTVQEGIFSCCGRRRKGSMSEKEDPSLGLNMLLNYALLGQLIEPQSVPGPSRVQSENKPDNDSRRSSDESFSSSFVIPPSEGIQVQQKGLLERLQARAQQVEAARLLEHAKGKLKRRIAVDFTFFLLWLVAVVWAIGFGKRCAPGTFEGWCNGYNSALAAGVFAAVAFAISVYLGCRDLRSTGVSDHA